MSQVIEQRLLAELSSAIPHLPKALCKLAEFIIANPHSAMFSSTAELAKAANVGEATIIRLCRRFGYDSYQSFKIALAAANLSNSKSQIPSQEDTLETRNQQLLYETLDVVRQTIESNHCGTLQDAIHLIRNSNNLLVFGIGTSSSTAREFAFRFLRAGIFAVAFEDIHEAALSLNVQRGRTVLLVLSVSGQTSGVIRALNVAKEQGMPSIAITTSAQSPVAQQAQIKLLTPLPPSASSYLGKIGQLLLLEVFMRELKTH